jgi:hypothetical protein
MKTRLRLQYVVASLAKAAGLGGGSRLALEPNPSFSSGSLVSGLQY